jgi:hypothetical protein
VTPGIPPLLASETTGILREYRVRVNRAIESNTTASVAEDLSGVMGAVITSRPVSRAVSILEREINLAIDAGELRGVHTNRPKQIVVQIREELLLRPCTAYSFGVLGKDSRAASIKGHNPGGSCWQ